MQVIVRHELAGAERIDQALKRPRANRVGEKVPRGSTEPTILVELGGGQVHGVGKGRKQTARVLLDRDVDCRPGSDRIALAQCFDRPFRRLFGLALPFQAQTSWKR